MTSPTFTIRSVQAFCYRYPLSTPVVTSFGRMLNRPAVFVRVEDEDGIVGWGEVWSNFPSTGAEHRARLVNEVLAPRLIRIRGQRARAGLRKPDAGHRRAGACSAASPVRSRRPSPESILRVWDLYARRRKHRAVEAARRQYRQRSRSMPAASIPTGSRQMAEAAMERGHRALKLKIGFDPGDRPRQSRSRFANSSATACWPPTPIRAGRSIRRWRSCRSSANSVLPGWKSRSAPIARGRNGRACAQAHGMPLAAGENIASRAGFAAGARRATCLRSFSPISPNGAG